MTDEVFESAVRTTGDVAGVFEYDGDTGYFYLYSCSAKGSEHILHTIHVVTGDVDFVQSDVKVQWDPTETLVGLFVRKALWAVFDTKKRSKAGGGYQKGAVPSFEVQAVEWARH